MNWALAAGWPFPFAVAAAVGVVFRLGASPGWGWFETASILVLNFAIVYGLTLVVTRLVVGEFVPKTVIIPTVVAALIAASVLLPRPESGWVRLGVGDLLQLPGMFVVGVLEDLTFAGHRDAMKKPERILRALHGASKDQILVESAARDEGGWLLNGSLQDAGGMRLPLWIHVDAAFTVQSTAPPDDLYPLATSLDGGVVSVLTREELATWKPGSEVERRPWPAATEEWLQAALEPRAARMGAGWIVTSQTNPPIAVVLDGDGAIGESIRLAGRDVAAMDAHGDRAWLLTLDWAEPAVLQGHVIGADGRDEAASAELTASLSPYALQTPLKLFAGRDHVWVASSIDGTPVVLVHPGNASAQMGRSVKDGVIDGDKLVVTTGRFVQRMDADARTTDVADVTVTEGLLSVLDGAVHGLVLQDKQLRAAELADGEAKPFLEGLVLFPK